MFLFFKLNFKFFTDKKVSAKLSVHAQSKYVGEREVNNPPFQPGLSDFVKSTIDRLRYLPATDV